MKTITICFCDNCGAQLPQAEKVKYSNCNCRIAQRNQRLEGVFSIEDGNRLLVLAGDDSIED